MATLQVEAPSLPSQLDARPMVRRTSANPWSKAEAARDRLYDAFLRACEEEAVEALVLKSPPSVYPPWVKFECWVPRGENRAVCERGSVTVTVQSRPYHVQEFEYDLEMKHRGRGKTLRRVAEFDPAQAVKTVHHLLDRGPRPGFRRFRENSLQFWRRQNRVRALRSDWLMATPLAFVALALFPTGFEILFWIAAIATVVLLSRRPVYVRVQGKPMGEPRSLARVDSWQTVVFGLGRDAGAVRASLAQALEKAPAHFRSQVERVWYWGLDGKEEREQFVVAFGRGMLFSQIYAYGDDLYVGWDGHLNVGQWVESTVATGVDRETGHRVKLNTVVSGTQPITEYDVIDLNCLMEWSHAQLVKIVKRLLEERHIDQEIDFKILRGERQRLSELGRRENKPLDTLAGRFGLKRTA